MRDDASRPQSTYFPGYGREMHAEMAQRSMAADAAFLTQHLRPGMRLLDCGSGPGTITLGLAEVVAPGEVTGIDISSVQVERARALAAERAVTNVRFELGDITALPFADRSFDVAFAHTVLMHLRDPMTALQEMCRVVRPGGIVAVRDHGAHLREPRTPAIEQLTKMFTSVAGLTLGRATLGLMRHKALLVEAGLTRVEGFADVTTYGNPERLREAAALLRALLASEPMRRNAASIGFDAATLERLAVEHDAWTTRPDAIVIIVWSAAIGWVD